MSKRVAEKQNEDYRVLLLVATKRDADITSRLLEKVGLRAYICRDVVELTAEIKLGAGSVVITDGRVNREEGKELLACLNAQPEWSDLPLVVMIATNASPPGGVDFSRDLTNVTVLERPAPVRTVISAVQTAVRARRRQYQIRDQIESIRRAEAHARDLQRQLEMSLSASELGTFSCPMPLQKVYWNDRCKAHFWLPPTAEVNMKRFYSIVHPDDRAAARHAVEQCVRHGKLYDIEYRTVSPTGAIRWVRATGRTTFDARNRPVSFDGTTQDVTARRQFEAEREALLASERVARDEALRANRVKDEFLATLGHELRTPLNAIAGWVELLKIEPLEAGTLSEGVGAIERNVRAQTQLIEDLLDVSRIISGKVRLDIRTVYLDDVIRAAVETVAAAARAKQVRIETNFESKPGPVRGDPARLQQVLWNLIANAVKFTPRDGKIEVTLKRVGSHVEVCVSDTGDGVPPDFLPHLFQRFTQADSSASRKHGGLGLGLSIVKSLTEMHGGKVWAESDGPGLGSSFHVRLPVSSPSDYGGEQPLASRVPENIASPSQKPDLKGIRFVVVDDEPDAREVLCRLLLACGATVEGASSALEGLELIRSFRPALILSDIGMPTVDGYEFLRQLRRDGVTTPAVALTAFARSEDRVRSIEAGFQAHLPKPIEPGELLAVIASLTRRSRAK